jgi:SOS response regulatory protein OraA/RecX
MGDNKRNEYAEEKEEILYYLLRRGFESSLVYEKAKELESAE